MSPGLAAMNDMAAAAGPFAGAARLLEEIGGVRLTAKRVERAAEASGAAVAAAGRERARLTAAKLSRAALAAATSSTAIDTVPMTGRETAGREGKGQDGRARTREVKLGVFFTQDKLDKDGCPVRNPASASVIATFEHAPVFAGLVKAEGIRPGADHVRQLTILGEGAAWICYPDVGIADLIPVTRLSRRSPAGLWPGRLSGRGRGGLSRCRDWVPAGER